MSMIKHISDLLLNGKHVVHTVLHRRSMDDMTISYNIGRTFNIENGLFSEGFKTYVEEFLGGPPVSFWNDVDIVNVSLRDLKVELWIDKDFEEIKEWLEFLDGRTYCGFKHAMLNDQMETT